MITLILEASASLTLDASSLTIQGASYQDLTLNIGSPEQRLHIIRWLGRLLDVMYARLHDSQVRQSLVGAADIPSVVVAGGTAWAHLHWLGGHTKVSKGDVEQLLSALGVSGPAHTWRQYCRKLADEAGIPIQAGLLE